MITIQSRALDADDEDKLRPLSTDANFKINIASTVGMAFCPFCGTSTKETIANARDKFEQLAELHARFQTIQSTS
jgi:hypothetical protein